MIIPDKKIHEPPKTYAHFIARWMILPLVQTPVTPNHLTTLRLVTGLLAAWWFSIGEYIWTVSAGFAFMLSMLLDRADGELARLSQRMSRGGHWYDLVCDMLVNVLIFIGIGFGLAESMGNWGPIMGIVSGLSVGAIFLLVLNMHQEGLHPSVAFNYPAGFDLDDSLFIIVIFAWMGAMKPLLIAAVIGAPAFLLFALWSRTQKPVD